jgi:amino acid adenylation domain-containing protein
MKDAQSPSVVERAAPVSAPVSGCAQAWPPEVRRDSAELAPASFGQRRLWFIDQLDPASAAYNMSYRLRLEGRLDIEALRRSFELIVARHEILRTTFVALDGEPRQRIHPAPGWVVPVIDLSAVPPAERDAEAARLARDEPRRPFDLARGPLLRTTLVKLGELEHVLLASMHHIASDGWSMGVLIGELRAHYAALVQGHQPALPELPVQYADFARWQRQALAGESLETQLSYWTQALADAAPTLDLPTDRPRSAVSTRPAAIARVELPAAVIPALRALATRERATLFMVLLAGFQALLHRWSGQTDILVGTPIAGRMRRELEPLIGFFVNTLVLRADLSGDPTFSALVEQVRARTLEAYAHHDIPFEALVERLAPRRAVSRTPLFQVMFTLQPRTRFEAVQLEGLRTVALEAPGGVAKFDLTLTLRESADAIDGNLEYDADLFDAELAARMARHYEQLMAAVVVDPGVPVSRARLLSPSERDEVLGVPSAMAHARPHGSLAERFADAVRARPDAVAVNDEAGVLSYAALDRRANQLARWLIRRGVGPGVPVALCMARTKDMVASIVAITKAGGVHVPIDPMYPRDRIGYILADACAQIVLTDAASAHLVPGTPGTLRVDRDWPVDEDATAPPVTIRPDQLAYIIYTSGTTGNPKGVCIPHWNVLRLFTATRRWFEFGADDVWSLFHSYGFDFSVWEMWGALLYGGRVVVVPALVSRSPELFHALLRRERVTILSQTPSAFRNLIAVDAASAALDSLRFVVLGGEALVLESLRPWIDRYGDQTPRLVNMYGITETTVHVTYRPIDRADVAAGKGSVIGRAIPDQRIYILDRHGDLAPVGVPGEIHVGDEGLARGYLGQPELTAERFVPDPFSGRPGARLYRSGDRARHIGHGDVEYLGRLDHQVKIRGFRIELGEIETQLRAHPDVGQCVVVARDDGGDRRLVAYVTQHDGAAPLEPARLRGHLRTRLPAYMVPGAFVRLDRFPLTASGKIDRKALPAPEQVADQTSDPHDGPRGPLEAAVIEVWRDVLRVPRVGVNDNFFDLGGHSLIATQVVSRLGKALGLEVPVRALFEAPTVAELAAHLETQRGVAAVGHRAPLVRLQSGDDTGPVFMIHPASGSVGCYARLVRLLRSARTIWGIEQVPGEAFATLEAVAQRYIAAIRAAQPAGPCALVGYSLGGTIAFEMARQLRARGEAVRSLVLLDAYLAGEIEADATSLVLGYGRQLGLRASVLDEAELGRQPIAQQLAGLLARAQARALLPPEWTVEDIQRAFEAYLAIVRPFLAYRPAAYDGGLILVRAQEEPRPGVADTRDLWRAYARGGVVEHTVHGDHHEFLHTSEDAVAAIVRAAVDP